MATLVIISEDEGENSRPVNVLDREAVYWGNQIGERVAGVRSVLAVGFMTNERLLYLGQIVCSDGDFRALMTAREMAR